GEVTADLRPDLEVLHGVPVEAAGYLRIVRAHSGTRPLGIVKPLASNVDIELRRQMKETKRVKSIPRARADRSVGVPAHVVLDDLSESRAPVLLDAQLHHGDIITSQARGGKDGVGTGVDRGRQPRPPLLLHPVVDLTDIADRARAALNEEGVGTQR